MGWEQQGGGRKKTPVQSFPHCAPCSLHTARFVATLLLLFASSLLRCVSVCPLASRSGQEEQQGKAPPPPQELANFGLSGKLAKDQNTGNVYKGVVLKVCARERKPSGRLDSLMDPVARVPEG